VLLEGSEAWNKAGTGHTASRELNYAPRRPDGTVDISRELEVNTEFDISRQLWSHLVSQGAIPDPSAFLERCPHTSFAWGEENVSFLQARYEATSANALVGGDHWAVL
jgi:malate dehydrogenase (quinone)